MSDKTAEACAEEQSSADDDDGFAHRVMQSFADIFWDPEIDRRGGPSAVGPIRKALAILLPGQPVEVRLNDDVEIVARARVNAAVRRGDPVTVENIADLETIEPIGVDANAGWVAMITLPDGRQFARFDFTRNRAKSLALLDLARQYVDSASTSLQEGWVGPAVESLLAATELAVSAQMYSLDTDERQVGARRNAHSARLHWTKVQVGLGNTIPSAHTTLQALNLLRPATRYGEGDLPSCDEVSPLVRAVTDLVEDAAARVGQLLECQGSGSEAPRPPSRCSAS